MAAAAVVVVAAAVVAAVAMVAAAVVVAAVMVVVVVVVRALTKETVKPKIDIELRLLDTDIKDVIEQFPEVLA